LIPCSTPSRTGIDARSLSNPTFITGISSPYGAGDAYGLAVDSAHIYWANGAGYIGRADLNGLT
jgi:hypothetical protein